MIRAVVGTLLIALLCVGCGATSMSASGQPPPEQSASPTPTVVQTFPPNSMASLRALAATQDEPTVLANEDVSIGGCQKARVSVLIPASTSPQAEAGMLAAAYFAEQVGGGVVFGYTSAADVNGPQGYTAGRIIVNDPCQADATVEVDLDSGTYTFPLG